MATTGVVGGSWRADVTPAGVVVPWDGSPPLTWHVAADDRWHDPEIDTGVRQHRVDGTAVFETRVRIPGGDAVQRVWSVADSGGFTVVEVTNDSSLPIAVAVNRADVLTTRPPTDVPIEGIDLPPGSLALPVGHRTTVRLALAHAASERTADATSRVLAGLPSADAVARGWTRRADNAIRLELPDATLVDGVRTARCELLLTGPADPAEEPARYLLGVAELHRMSEVDAADLSLLVPDVATAVTALEGQASPVTAAALNAAAFVLASAGERRAVGDVLALVDPTRSAPIELSPPGGADPPIEVIAAIEHRVARGPLLFPDSVPSDWRGVDLEVHGLVAGPATRLAVAVRWHGPNPAVLWETTGDPVVLRSGIDPAWTSAEPAGEALWTWRDPAAAYDRRP
ncbi:hypothetical protein BH24ACT5_BH24ACT5_27420 [soil metagenome]